MQCCGCQVYTEESGHAVCNAAVVRYILKNQVMQCAVLWLSGICLQLERLKLFPSLVAVPSGIYEHG